MDPFNNDVLPVNYELPFWRISRSIDNSGFYSSDPIIVIFERVPSDSDGWVVVIADITCSDVKL